MTNRIINSVKLGTFVLGGLLFLVILLFMIGKNRNLFGDTFLLKAKFENIQGLVTGNNVRFSGIQAGTVRKIVILNDTLIEVTMVIEKKMLSIIRKNAIASIGTEGLVGNKVVNIVPSKLPSPYASEGDILESKKSVNMDDMLQTLSKTNNDIYIVAANLKETVQRINKSNALWNLLDDPTLPQNIKISVANIRSATGKAGTIVDNLSTIISDVKNGKGSVGTLLKDSLFAQNLNEAIVKIKGVGEEADTLAGAIQKMVNSIQQDINNGKGTANALLKDSQLVIKLNASIENIQKGTDGFNQNMEALKHNFLFRGYFKKLEKKKKASK